MNLLRRAPVLALAVGSLMATSAVLADTFQTPAEVMAAADGSFSYEVAYLKGEGSAHFGGYGWFGDTNVLGGGIGDAFCVTTVDPGWTLRFTVSGKLKNPNLGGTVYQDVSLCGAPGGSSSTSVRPFDPLGVGGPAAGRDARLWNDPNPFTSRTTFHFALPAAGPVTLGIYDVAGRLVVRVVDGELPAGPHEVAWDRSALRDAHTANGVLFARLSFGGRVQMRRMVLLQ